MTTNAPGRNDPCPCGSGKKYKRCCWNKDREAVSRDHAPAPEAPAWKPMSLEERTKIAEEIQELDDLSNGALDHIKAGRYDEAQKLCDELFRKYPDVIDGHDRLGMLREAQGRFEEAADHYGKSLAIVEQHLDDYGPEVPELFRKRRDKALAKAKPPL